MSENSKHSYSIACHALLTPSLKHKIDLCPNPTKHDIKCLICSANTVGQIQSHSISIDRLVAGYTLINNSLKRLSEQSLISQRAKPVKVHSKMFHSAPHSGS